MIDLSEYSAVVIGCGITGAAIARQLAESGKKVLILERRDHIGGNMYDYTDEHGILVQKYGPHTFHTKKKELYEYMLRFEEWEKYKLTCGAYIDGKCTPTPFNFQTIDDYYSEKDAVELKEHIKAAFPNRETATVIEVMEHPDPIVSGYAKFLFEKDYSLYTAKQWGISPDKIDPSVLKRVPLRFSYDIGYFDDAYEVMPKHSFTEFFNNLLNHENITVKLNTDAFEYIIISGNKLYAGDKELEIPVVYSGAIDELFGGVYGRLPYRSLRFEWKYEEKDSIQDMPVVAYPQAEGFTRITEFKKIPVQDSKGTAYAVEYPLFYDADSEAEPYYPVLTEESQEQYAKYKELAAEIPNLFVCGRLGEFKYYNMDQALERALEIADNILSR